jgi:cytochrome c oxidase subunit IV
MGDETETTVTETDEGAVTGAALATIDDEKRELSRHPERLPMLPGELRPHPTPRQYVLIAVVLVIITAFEVAASYLDGDINSNLLIILLTVMAAVKFFLVVAWYMHLRTDLRIFRRVFITGLLLAGAVYMIALSTLHIFNTGKGAR